MGTGRGAANQELGRRGEDLAVCYLERQGMVVLSRNWRCHLGELDVIAADGDVLVVCEVKTRSGTGFGGPEEAVTRVKLRRMRTLANQWLSVYRVGWCSIRCDVIAVLCRPDGRTFIDHRRGVV
ncbi:YraN family protein [Allokutzneria sp. A3M-2-11 16]|uniref:YraN family protein n=1 Tax=Allokutzneria sp. A3M-2-11 16 TaxID=2962043 RepID=UPI0020B83A7D|nr:YraN family protein [Allokutzneria sp. A3M-2-11 16]MCP3797992.1 YraN family protein [Allokutzneria sp. A3M-2-11 16]